MVRWSKRFGFALVALVLLLYLTVNLLLNLDLVQRPVESHLQNQFERRVELGFVYLNWRFHPTVSTVIVNPPEAKPSGSGTRLVGTRLALMPDWEGLIHYFQGGSPRTLLRTMRLQNLRVEVRSGDSDDPAFPDQVAFSGGRLPDYPIQISSWQVHTGNRELVSGSDGVYSRSQQRVTSSIDRLGGLLVEGEGDLRLGDKFSGRLRLRKLPLAPIHPGLNSGHLATTVRFSARSDSLHYQVSGGLKKLFEQDLALELAGEGKIRSDEIRLDRLWLQSPEGRIYVEGLWEPGQARWLLRSRYRYRPGPVTEGLLTDYFPGVFELRASERLHGTVRLGGGPERIRSKGDFHWNQARLYHRLNTRGITYRLDNVQGGFVRDQVQLQQGQLKADDVQLDIESGLLVFDPQNFLMNLRGRLEANELPDWVSDWLPSGFLPLNGFRAPLEASMTRAPEDSDQSFRRSLRLGSGEFQLGDKSFQLEELVYGEASPESENLLATVTDPGGNPWQFRLEPTSRWRLESEPEDVTWLVREAEDVPDLIRRGTSLENVGIQLEGDLDSMGLQDFEAAIDLDSARAHLGDRDLTLGEFAGGLNYVDQELRSRDLVLRGPGGELSLSGSIDVLQPLGASRFDLGVEAKNFQVDELTQALKLGVLRSEVDLTGTVQGTLNRPEVDLSLAGSGLRVGPYLVEEPRLRVRPRPDFVSWELISGRMMGGDLYGTGRFYYEGDAEASMALTNARAGRIAPWGSWVEDNIQGRVDMQMNWRGKPTDRTSWNGVVSLANNGVVMDRFPPLPGIAQVANLDRMRDEFPVRNETHSFPIESGRLVIPEIRYRTTDSEFQLDGFIGVNGDLRLRGELELRGGLLRTYLQDLLGQLYRATGLSAERRLVLPFDFRGPISDPEMEVDKESIRRQFRRNFIGSIFSDRLSEPIMDALDTIF